MRRWDLWRLPLSALAVLSVIEAGAVTAVILIARTETPTSHQFSRIALLGVLFVVFTEVTDRIDRVRRYVNAGRMTIGSMSVWAIAAAITLPAGWAGLLVAALFAYALLRAMITRSARPHRMILTGASVVLATIAASALVQVITTDTTALLWGPRYLMALVAGVVGFQLINYTLVSAVVYLVSRPAHWRSIRIRTQDLAFEYVTLCLGVFTGQVLLHTPWVTPAVLGILALPYRASMAAQLQVETTVDAKTGLLNFTAWRELARRALARTGRAGQSVAVAVIDLDRFKQVNDTYGHLFGDQVLATVATCIRTNLRDYDIVGRFGGAQFVLMLDNADLYAAVSAATRLRETIAELVVADGVGITVSIGVAHSAKSAASLETLIERADAALYEAKAAGRNTVRAVAAFAESPSDAVA